MYRRLLIIDVALGTLLVLGGLRIREEWQTFWATHQVGNIQAAPETIGAVPAAAPSAAPALSDWTEIVTRNPFSFDRTDAPIIASQPDQGAGPKPILFGTMSLGQRPLAMLASGQAGNREARPVYVGESIDGWVLVEILDKSVVVRAGDRQENVAMNDPTAQVARTYEKTPSGAATQVVQPPPPASPQVNNTTSPAAPAASTSNAPRPNPLDANGQPKKGRWVYGPFGTVFVED